MVALETSPLFQGLAPGDFAELAEAALVLTLSSGHRVFEEGETGNGLYVIESGQVEIATEINAGERRILTRFGPGDFFGEMAVIDDAPRSASATTLTDSVLLFYPRDRFSDLVERRPRITLNLLREFSRRLRDFNRHYVKELLQAERLALVGRFARSIVHDLKNPLNIIGIAAEISGMEKASLERRQAASRRILKQVDRLNNMISELLEFTRSQDARVVSIRPDFARFTQELLLEVGEELQEREVRLIVENEPPEQPLRFDPVRLAHVFHNLLNNASEAMGSGGEVRVRFCRNPKEIVVQVEDKGPGIAPEVMPRLFETFATFGKDNGTGLGLSICKRVIEDHGGRITASNLPAGGAMFCFTIPIPEDELA